MSGRKNISEQISRIVVVLVLLEIIILIYSEKGLCLVCTKDLNGNGQIEANTEKWTCLSTNPPLCPQDLTNCNATPYLVSGSASVAPTSVAGRNGFSRIAAGIGLIDFSGWSCSSSSCSETYGGKLSFSEGTVSGAVSAEKITKIAGSGNQLQIFGCSGSGCTESLVGSITVSGANFSGTVSAPDGLVAVSANVSSVSFSGTVCRQAGCSTAVVGSITLSGTRNSCPYGSQYSCADVGGIQKCSQISCLDETGNGQIGAGQKICSKDLNGDGNIDFASEIVNCSTVQGKDFCPMGAVSCGSGSMTPICPTDGTGCPGGTYNATLKWCETAQVVTGYRCPSNGSTYSDQASCQSACMQTANCSSGTYGVSVSADQSSSYWFYNGAYRMYCGGSGMYLTANPGGNNRSWSLSGTSCSGDANCGQGGAVTYLVGSGNQLLVYGCEGVWSDEYQQFLRANCGMLCGVLTFDRAVVGGSTRAVGCVLDDASYLSFHDQCDWGTWTSISISGASYLSCPLGNYPCNSGTCTAGSACTTVLGCPAGWQLVNNTCIAQPQGGTPITINETSHLCEAQSVNSCPGMGSSYDSEKDSCVKNVDCDGGILDGGLDLCIFTIGTDQCPAGFAYNSVYSACLKDAFCSDGGNLNLLRDVCETANNPTCTDGFTLDAALNKCLAAPSCQIGNYDAGLGQCTVLASSLAPSGYVFNAGLDRFELSPPPCPDGSSYSSTADLCTTLSTIACPTPGIFNAASGKCETAMTPGCSGGLTYDGSVAVCQKPSTCPGGGATLNAGTDKCELAIVPACAGSYVWNARNAKCELDPLCSFGLYNSDRDRCEFASNATSCLPGYIWNASAGKCQAAPSCSAGSYNPATDRCEQAATPNYACSLGSNYPSVASCQAGCFQTAACTVPAVSGSGSWDNWGETCIVVGSGNCLYFYMRYGGSNVGPVCFSGGITFSGNIQASPPGGTHGSIWSLAAIGGNIYANVTSTIPGCGIQSFMVGGISVSGGYASGGGAFAQAEWGCPTVPPGYTALDRQANVASGYGSGNQLIVNHVYGEMSGFSVPITFTSTTQVCPLGGHGCSGGYCSSPGNCSGPTYSCPAGWTMSGSICYKASTCFGSGALNTSSDKCETAGSPSCSTGTYDASNGVCHVPAACPNSGALNASLNKCQLNFTNSCPVGFTLNTGFSVCQASPQCSTGLYNPARDRCEAAYTEGCPSTGYYVWNAARDLCDSDMIKTCSLDGFFYSPSLDLCMKTVACPSGGTLSGVSDICTLQMTSSLCPSGFIYDPASDKCMNDPCSSGVFNASLNRCEIDVTANCPGGYSYSSNTGLCQMSPLCDTGSSYDGGVDRCSISGSSLCPAQYTFNFLGSRCEKSPSCDAGSTYSVTYDLCLENVMRQCPTSEYVYQASSRQCTATPICYVGNFDQASKMCTGAGSNCPLGNQHECLPHPTTGILQCSNSTCFTMTNQPTQKTNADTRGYLNDGTLDPITGVCQGQAIIFNGKGRECRQAGVSTTFFNCCNTDPGSFLFIQNACGSEELMTVKGLAAGNCHFVGDYCKEKWPLIGCVQRANMYCCFGSKLSRIIHEQGRTQLQAFKGWGGAENPECRGFTPEEFQMLDFTKIDLSEYFSDIKNKSQSAIQQNMQQKVSEFYEKVK